MKNHYYKILKYLYNHQDGEFHPVENTYQEKKVPNYDFLHNILRELAKEDLIERESVYNYRGIATMDIDTGEIKRNGNNPAKFKAKITINGCNDIEKRTINICGSIVQKRNFFIVLFGSLIALLALIIGLF